MSNIFDLVLACWVEDGTPFLLLALVGLGLFALVAAWFVGWVGKPEPRPSVCRGWMPCPWCGVALDLHDMSPGWAACCPDQACGFMAHAATVSRLASLVGTKAREMRETLNDMDEAA